MSSLAVSVNLRGIFGSACCKSRENRSMFSEITCCKEFSLSRSIRFKKLTSIEKYAGRPLPIIEIVHVQVKNSERQISLWMTFRSHHTRVEPLIRHGGRVIDTFRPRLTSPSIASLLSSRRRTTITHFSRNISPWRALHEKVSSDTRLESRIKCHGNVNKMPSIDTFAECLSFGAFHFAARRAISLSRESWIANEIFNYITGLLFFLCTLGTRLSRYTRYLSRCWKFYWVTLDSQSTFILNEQFRSQRAGLLSSR